MNAEDGTPAPEEDEEMEDGEEGEQGEEGEGEAEDVAVEEGVAEIKDDEAVVPTPAPEAVLVAAEAVGPTISAEVPIEAEATTMEVDAPGAVGDVPGTATSLPNTESTTAVPDATIPTISDEAIPSPSEPSPVVPTPEESHTTESGSGDLAGVGGVAIIHGEVTGMEVDENSGATRVAEEGGEKGEVLEMDDGLVMGDLEPVREEFVVQGEDKPREVDM
jgi:hypothetical protein